MKQARRRKLLTSIDLTAPLGHIISCFPSITLIFYSINDTLQGFHLVSLHDLTKMPFLARCGVAILDKHGTGAD